MEGLKCRGDPGKVSEKGLIWGWRDRFASPRYHLGFNCQISSFKATGTRLERGFAARNCSKCKVLRQGDGWWAGCWGGSAPGPAPGLLSCPASAASWGKGRGKRRGRDGGGGSQSGNPPRSAGRTAVFGRGPAPCLWPRRGSTGAASGQDGGRMFEGISYFYS